MSALNAGPVFGFAILGLLLLGFIAIGVKEAREERRERGRGDR